MEFQPIQSNQSYSVIVVGGTASGVGAAIAAARLGKSVALVENTSCLGGMISSGLSNTDIGISPLKDMPGFPDKPGIENKEISSGLFEEFRQKILLHYGNSPECEGGFRYEPKVAKKIIHELVKAENNIHVDLLSEFKQLTIQNNKITQVIINKAGLEKIIQLAPKAYVIDASDCGDVATAGGCDYVLGRESKDERNEAFAGEIYFDDYAAAHENKLKFLVNPPFSTTHKGDERVQAYSYLLTLKDYKNIAPNLILQPPQGYNPSKYDIGNPFTETWAIKHGYMPNEKYELNVHPKGSDLQEINFNYANGDRSGIEEQYRQHALGYLYYIQNKLGLKNYGLANDEYTDNNNFPYRLYVRESRRIKGHYTFCEGDATPFKFEEMPNGQLKGEYKSYNDGVTFRPPRHGDSIGVVSYAMDSHATRLYPNYKANNPNFRHRGEGEFYISSLTGPGTVPFRILVPNSGPNNLLVSHAVSATHVGYGTLRMEPIRMGMGQAAGCAASLAVDKALNNHELIDGQGEVNKNFLSDLQGILLGAQQKCILYFYKDVGPGHWANEAVQKLSLSGVFRGYFDYQFKPGQMITRAEFVKTVMVIRKVLSQDHNFSPPSRDYVDFADVKQVDWFYSYVKEAYELNIINGSSNQFKPNSPITRAEVALIIIRAFDFNLKSFNYLPFSDVNLNEGIKPWYYDGIGTINELGIMKGDNKVKLKPGEKTTFRPLDGLNRAEAAVVTYRVVEKLRTAA